MNDATPSCTLTLGEDTSEATPGFWPLPLVSSEHYTIHGVHACGGLGRILRAVDRRTDRVVAIKELVRRDRVSELRFVREIEITAHLRHPAIVPLYDAGRWGDGTLFYAMKFIYGSSLKTLLDKVASLEERLALIHHVVAVAETMVFAHSKNVVHRDIKPSNVLVGSYGETVVIDWGLAKNLDEDPITVSNPLPPREVSVAGVILGTPAYMAPEQARGTDVDERVDVHALGAMLYHLAAGVPPFPGSRAVALAREPVPVQEREPRVPCALAAIIAKAMAVHPCDRHSSARALADDLRALMSTPPARSSASRWSWSLAG